MRSPLAKVERTGDDFADITPPIEEREVKSAPSPKHKQRAMEIPPSRLTLDEAISRLPAGLVSAFHDRLRGEFREVRGYQRSSKSASIPAAADGFDLSAISIEGEDEIEIDDESS